MVRVYYWIYFFINECKFFVLTFNKILLLYSWVWLFQPSVVKFNSLIGLACWNVIADFLYHLYLKHHLNKHCFDVNFVITVSVVLISVLGVKRITGEDCWLVRISLFFLIQRNKQNTTETKNYRGSFSDLSILQLTQVSGTSTIAADVYVRNLYNISRCKP